MYSFTDFLRARAQATIRSRVDEGSSKRNRSSPDTAYDQFDSAKTIIMTTGFPSKIEVSHSLIIDHHAKTEKSIILPI